MTVPFVTSRGKHLETKAQIDKTLYLLQNVKVPDKLNEGIESRLAAARLNLVLKNSDHELNTQEKSASCWYPMRIAACALAVAAASLGLVADRSIAGRPTAPVPVVTRVLPHTGMDSAAAVRVPTHAVSPGKLAPGRTERTLDSGRNTLAKRGLLPPGVAVPKHPPAAPVEAGTDPANSDTSR